MSRTNHMKKMSRTMAMERVRNYLLESVGNPDEELSEEAVGMLLQKIRRLRQALSAASRRGGVTVVTAADHLITAYRCDSYNAVYIEPKTHIRSITEQERRFIRSLCAPAVQMSAS